MDARLTPLGWLGHILACFFLVRSIRPMAYRAVLTIVPCFLLTLAACRHLPYLQMTSIMTISLCWMVTIRLVHLIVLVPGELQSLRSYAWKFLWLVIPIVPCKSTTSPGFYVALAAFKLLVSHWINRWLLTCTPSDSYARIAMFFVTVCAGSFMQDLLMALVQLLTRNKYTVLEFNNYPFLARTVREFWGRRYNRLISSLLKESVFDPLRRLHLASTLVAAMASFVVSGLLHAHVAMGGFGASSPLPAFAFFALQGIACCAESLCPFTLPKPVGILLTQAFLLVTAPLYLGLFTRAGPEFYALNKPPLFDAPWMPKIPVPNFCPS